ncbi:MAG: DUF4307 domain-containing protein [Candidatus Nanopelagicales bacterium]|nr:DUF4307 domain-containing protein [Candidatus Nanopelagicales bacterium]
MRVNRHQAKKFGHGSSLPPMGSPFSRDQLSPEMRERYGLDKRRSTTVVIAIVAIVAFLGVMAYVGAMLLRGDVQFLLLRWTVVADDRADATFEVRRDGADAVVCVLRAQDSKRIDVGYAEIDIPPGEGYTLVNYSLRTVAPAFTVEVLTCARTDELRAPGPQFPPGIAIPEQPWTSP